MTTFNIAHNARMRWVDHLRNGLEQTHGRLANAEYNAFCCLGVAEEFIGPSLEIFRDVSGCYVNQSKYIASGMLHNELRELLGLSIAQCDQLAGMNDGGVGFKVIADTIAVMDYFCEDGIFSPSGNKIGVLTNA